MVKASKFNIIDRSTLRPRGQVGARSCLFVGDPMSMRRAKARLTDAGQLTQCEIYDVLSILRSGAHPELVISYAISPLFDCLDLAQLLKMENFGGRQRILNANLPAPKMICREVQNACPGLDFGVLQMGDFQLH